MDDSPSNGNNVHERPSPQTHLPQSYRSPMAEPMQAHPPQNFPTNSPGPFTVPLPDSPASSPLRDRGRRLAITGEMIGRPRLPLSDSTTTPQQFQPPVLGHTPSPKTQTPRSRRHEFGVSADRMAFKIAEDEDCRDDQTGEQSATVDQTLPPSQVIAAGHDQTNATIAETSGEGQDQQKNLDAGTASSGIRESDVGADAQGTRGSDEGRIER